MKQLRIGFLSTAGIARRNWKAILHSGNCLVSAVASRDLDKSRQFIAECQAEHAFPAPPEALGSYEALIQSPSVDAIYFPLPTGLRQEWVRQAAEAGKHILSEKPCANDHAELATTLSICREQRVQFMDGVMFMHSPRLAKVREVLNDEQRIGRLRHMDSAFCFYGGEPFFRNNIRLDGDLEPTGCLGDLGWYSIRLALWVMNWQLPVKVTGKILTELAAENCGKPTPAEFSGELFFEGGFSVSFYCSFITGYQQWAHVSGERGWLRLPDFVHPLDSYEPAFEVNDEFITVTGGMKCPPNTHAKIQGHATAQDTRMWRHFAGQVCSGQLNDDWPMWALKTQQVLDACHAAAIKKEPVHLV